MATIEISPGFVSGYVSRMMSLGSSTAAPSDNITSQASTNGLMSSAGTYNFSYVGNLHFYVMKGTVPANFSTLVNISARVSDVLISYTTSTNNANNFSPSVTNTNPVVVSTNYVTASASGTATWFWWTVRPTFKPGYPGLYDSDPLIHQIIGTVGVVGSGADLEIPDTNIVSGVAYRILNLRLQFPTSWTF